MAVCAAIIAGSVRYRSKTSAGISESSSYGLKKIESSVWLARSSLTSPEGGPIGPNSGGGSTVTISSGETFGPPQQPPSRAAIRRRADTLVQSGLRVILALLRAPALVLPPRRLTKAGIGRRPTMVECMLQGGRCQGPDGQSPIPRDRVMEL